jgi:hypothetical protein
MLVCLRWCASHHPMPVEQKKAIKLAHLPGAERKRRIHCTWSDINLTERSTRCNPPRETGCISVFWLTRCFLPAQKKEKISLCTTWKAQVGMATREAVYHRPDRARAFRTRALPASERWRWRQERTTARNLSRRESQLACDRSPWPIQMPKALMESEVHWRATGESRRMRQDPAQRPLHFAWFSFDPEACSY